ncbi:MAG: hypothetical protein ACPGJS_05765 [Flammeovirgaceae bacterium]
MNRIELSNALEDMLEDYQYLHKTVELVKDVMDQGNAPELNEFEYGKLHDLIKSVHQRHKEIDEDIATIQKIMGYKLL